MLKIASLLLRFQAIFGLFFALFAGTILLSTTAHAANSQPTYTLTAGSLISAKGGFIDDPNASNPMFIQSGGKWVFEGAGDSRQAGYYNPTTREIYFKWSATAQAYVTHTNYANSGGIVIAGDACDVSIKLDPGVTTGGTFVGVSVKTGKQTSDCTTAVKDKIQLSSDPVFNNVSQATGETFFGVTIPTCTQTAGTSQYNTCVSQRKTALSNLANAITCDTSSQQGITECTYNKSILTCLQANVANTVAHCKTKADAQAILNGDYSAITADTTNDSIKKICQTLSGADNQKKCIAAATAERDRLKNVNGTGKNETSCAVDGIGWIVCPILTFMAKANDSAFTFLQKFLGIRPSLISDKGTQNAWAAFRDIANVAFVIAFLVIVYSQLTSAGVSNYGIKKMLPRIVVAAILVNLSFYICQIAVDISNIVGSSIYTLLKDSIPVNANITNPSWQDQTSNILARAATGIFVVLLIILVIAAPITLLAFGLIILILIARQAFVILLVVMAPLAFVAYLLPNTEIWFKKWWKAFSTILMVYPIIGVVFGASTLAANILSSAAANEDDASLLQLMALGVMAVPLFAVPALLKGSLAAAGSVGQKLANLQDRVNQRASGQAKERAGKEWGALQGNLTRRALNPQGRLGAVFGARRRATARREARYDEAERRKKAAEESFRNTDAAASTREARALNDEQTAKLNKQVLQNQTGLTHLNNNAGLHAAATTTGLDLHNAEETHKNEVESEHMRDVNNHGQYDNLNASRGDKQNAELETKLRFEGSDVAFDQSQMKQMFEGQLDITKGDQQVGFESSGVGQAQAVEKDRVAQEKKVASSTAEEMAIELNEGVRVNAAAAEQSVAAAKAGETALVEELKTEAGAAAHAGNPELVQAAQQLNDADTVLRVQTQRNTAAKRVADVEYAHDIRNDSTGLAVDAGGIQGAAGVSQAKATATQTILKAFKEGVAAESTLLSEVKENVLLGDVDDPTTGAPRTVNLSNPDILDQPNEVISAIGATIAGRQHMQSHIKLWNRASELRRDAERAVKQTQEGTPERATAEAKLQKAKDLQQVIMSSKSKTPFGIGDQAQGDAVVGDYTGDILTETRERILTNLSPEAMATSLDPDDYRLIYEMGRAGKLGPEHVAKIKDSYEKWQANPNINGRLKDKIRVLVDPIVAGDYSAGPSGDRFPEVNTMSNA